MRAMSRQKRFLNQKKREEKEIIEIKMNDCIRKKKRNEPKHCLQEQKESKTRTKKKWRLESKLPKFPLNK